MDKRLRISDLVTDSRLLHFFFKEERPLLVRILFFMALFFLLPVALLLISFMDSTLRFPGKPVGMLEDYLFLSFAFGVAPLLIFFLRYVIRRFIYFIDDVPSFSRISKDDHETLKNDALSMIVELGKKNKAVFLKYALGLVALSSNMSSIIKRADGWDALAHPLQLSVVFIYLVIMLVFVLNSILFKYILVLWAEIQLSRRLAKSNVIEVRPLAPDKSGGLRNLGELSLAFTYFLLPFTLVGMTHYFTWRTMTVGSALGLIAFIPMFIIVFFLPLGVVHRVMADSKRETLHNLSEKYLEISRLVENKIKCGSSHEDLAGCKDVVEMLDGMYAKAEAMPVWPFNIKILTRFISITLGPVAIIFLESMLQTIIDKFFK